MGTNGSNQHIHKQKNFYTYLNTNSIGLLKLGLGMSSTKCLMPSENYMMTSKNTNLLYKQAKFPRYYELRPVSRDNKNFILYKKLP